MAPDTPSLLVRLWPRKSTLIAVLALMGIVTHIVLRFGFDAKTSTQHLPLLITLVIGGLPLLYDLLRKLLKREFGSDLLGGISIVTSVIAGRIPGRLHHRAHALRRRGVGELRACGARRRCWRHWPNGCRPSRIGKRARTSRMSRWRRSRWGTRSSSTRTRFVRRTAWWWKATASWMNPI
jgi:hypothetical protein